MPAARVVSVAPGSPAEQAGLAAGDEILTVNGEQLRDVIAYQLHADGAEVDLEVRRGGLEQQLLVRKTEGASLGLELSHAVFDRVQTCDNHCPFCFIHQLPKGMRRSLYLQDDDFRLSFLYGNFTTLTRFTEADFERVVSEQLSPLYVSIHATDPEVRTRLLRNRRGATSLRWLALLLDAGIEVHGQIVVCPGINDGAVLDDTLLGVLDRFPKLATLGVVPLGVSAHTREPEMRAHTIGEARAVVSTMHAWQARFHSALGRRLVYASDEYYLLAGFDLPELDAYDGCLQHENGIGMARAFEAEVRAALAGDDVAPTGVRSGFFAAVDGAPADGYRAPRTPSRTGVSTRGMDARSDAGSQGRGIGIVTGELGARVLEPLVSALGARAGVEVRLVPVPNAFFGGNIGVTGLLTGTDVAAALADQPEGDRYLLPDVVLSRGRFLDGETVAVLPRPVEVVATDGDALVRAMSRPGAGRRPGR
jgi:putative radical SAM enzyme (TIGR03279 family)